MRLLPALVGLLALSVSACDSGGDIEPLGGVLVVTLRQSGGGNSILLESEADVPCAPRIAAEQEFQPERLTISVLGTEPVVGDCPATPGPATRTVPLTFSGQGTFAVEILFGGLSDEYAYVVRSNGVRLDSVRTTVTRLGPR
ncbi:MAG TPA: hypothetical protein VF576_08550 [Rubricoccaceae bacterium]|jgi:hypothetical protein